jgi:hypothetical protein
MDSKSYRTDALRKLVLLPVVFSIATFNCNQVNPSQPVTPAYDGSHNVRALCVSGPCLFAGTDHNGIFRSTNNGDSWIAVNSGLTPAPAGRSGTCVLSFAVSGSTIFAGTGYDQGIFRSSDNGASWEPVNSGLPFNFPLTSVDITALIVHRDCIFAGTLSTGIFLSTDNGENWTDVSSGLTSWMDESTGCTIKYSVRSFAECGGDLFAGTDGGVFRLTHNDIEDTRKWTAVNSGLKISFFNVSLAVSGSNIFAGSEEGVFLSTDHGASWKLVSSGISNIPQPNAYIPIITSVFVSGNRLFASRQWGVFLSTDNGASWTAVKSGLSYVETFIESGSTIFAGTAGSGVFRSTNKGDSWTAVNSGLMY